MELEYHKSVLEEEDEFSNDSVITHIPEEAKSLINFKAINNGGESSLLSFQQKDYCLWDNNNDGLHHHQNSDPRLIQDFNCIQTSSGHYGGSKEKQQQQGESSSYGGWLYSVPSVPSDNNSLQNYSPRTKEASFHHKRLSMVESMQVSKKQCTAASKSTPKPTKANPSKDPQSIAAKNRRERISERLKILQELVPNGSKVDLVTMLEKAISYVKFLQLQVKVLATDEFWPVQGGKAPDISQAKEAIDAILSSQRDRNSSSTSKQHP